MSLALRIAAVLCSALALAGTAYYVLCEWAVRRFLAQHAHPERTRFAPPVSILKSLKGLDPHMWAAFRSHCLLDYGEYEILFGVSDLADPALALVRRLQEEFPERALRIVHCPQILGMNGKVSNLAQMLPHARYEHVLINDSDIFVEPDYLRRTMVPFAQDKVGMTTTLYRAAPGNTLASKLEALGISTDFMGGVLVAREMEGSLRFGLGATIATTKSVLREIGGFEALVDHLGDDYELGARAAQQGYQVELVDVVVETALPDYGWKAFWSHQLRWARNVKDRRTAQYFGLVVTFGLAWALLAVLWAPRTWWTWMILALMAFVRLRAAVLCGKRLLGDRRIPCDLWLVPLRDLVALAIWTASFFGNEIEWRGEHFRLRSGKLQPLS